MPLRVLVLDECGLQRWVVERLCPAGTRFVGISSFEDAMRIVREDPPDVAVVSVSPARLPWRAFQHACAEAEPPIPVLYESCLFSTAHDAGLEPLEGYAEFLVKPAERADLQAALERLFAASSAAGAPLAAG